jgi:cell division protein FtsI (penicillin-binding protein 3)
MAKMASQYYGSNPGQFLKQLKKMRMDTMTGIDLVGEGKPVIYKPGGKIWGPTTLPWMAFGYNLSVTPLQTTVLYNSIANGGRMMKPYLVTAIKEQGVLLQQFEPTIVDENICSKKTLEQLKACLEGVCIAGTAKDIFKNSPYKVAGKTGTALVANNNRGYADKIYQSSFAGYFPAENPQYTCVVIIKNKAHAPVYYGGAVAGPVFREIADRLYSTYIRQTNTVKNTSKADSSSYNYTGYKKDIAYLNNQFKLPYADSTSRTDEWIDMNGKNASVTLTKKQLDNGTMPELKGMGLKDVVYLCENIGLKVNVKGRGKVAGQSILPGSPIVKGQLINIAMY